MIPATFKYQRAHSVDDAIAALAKDPGAKLLQGGHSLLPLMKLRLARPGLVVDIGQLAELRTIDVKADSVFIGAAVRYHEIADHAPLAQVMPVLKKTVSVIADPQVRHRGTIGGSAAHADPTSDLAAVFLAADARFMVRGPGGERVIRAADWYVAPLITALASDEVLLGIEFARPSPDHQTYLKFAHPASGYALAGVAALVSYDATLHVTKAQIAVTGAGVLPFRAKPAENFLTGERLTRESAEQAAQLGADAGEYEGDVQYPAEYRKNLARVMIRRALESLA
ncbi:MAG: xanthine dehydrogenase family protein subunit M [Sulfobacillus acidophilus]|uniref:Xanthine dehydrogenase family protein subunit M n=1 Tax=Sulfobacillus acidophilus TaxID=53633 RepID=A0A2T2WJ20_9FIRM|nr:MAG: xanthine dehydrogenase family protein subunit M [Sulfobacillus acidophilus]